MLSSDTLAAHPRHWAQVTPHRPAFIMDGTGEVLTFAELDRRANQAAHLFERLGVRAGDTIAILAENQIRFSEIVWAAKNSGLRYVAISTHLNAADTRYIIDDCGAKLLVATHQLRDVAVEAAKELSELALLMIDGAVAHFRNYEAELAECPATRLLGRGRGASMLYSSGTTGRPKGITTKLGGVPPETPPQRAPIMRAQWSLDEQTVFLNPGPFYHSGPLRIMMIVQRYGGTAIGFQRFDPVRVLQAIERYRATHGFFVPTMFIRMLGLEPAIRNAVDTSSMTHAIHGAAPCPIHVKQAMIDWLGPVIHEMYGSTEALGHCFSTSEEWLAHPGSVGRPANGTRVKIVDKTGAELPVGEIGRVAMRNGLVASYHGAAAKTPIPYDAEGFASVGDLGYVDEDGYLYLTDRENDVIISGGVNIYPQEAESVLLRHPAVRDAAVFGVPHSEMGEQVKAVVEPTVWPDDPEALSEQLIVFCRENLSAFKCPRSIDFDPALPRSEAGKMLRRVVRSRYWPRA